MQEPEGFQYTTSAAVLADTSLKSPRKLSIFMIKFTGLQYPEKLMIDFEKNCAVHYDLGNLVALFLPPNTTAIIQPLDQDTISAFKARYQRCLVHWTVMQYDKPDKECKASHSAR